MGLFDANNPASVEAATLVKLADLVANTNGFATLAKKTVGAEARAKVILGPFPRAWEGSFTKEQLAGLFCTANIWVPDDSEKIVVPDTGSFTQPQESGVFHMTTRRYVTAQEFEEDQTGNDIYLHFVDQIGLMETEMVKLSDLAATNASNYPHPLRVRRVSGPSFGLLSEKSRQGEYLWCRHWIGWGIG